MKFQIDFFPMMPKWKKQRIVVALATTMTGVDRRQHNNIIFLRFSIYVRTAGVGKTNWSCERKFVLNTYENRTFGYQCDSRSNWWRSQPMMMIFSFYSLRAFECGCDDRERKRESMDEKPNPALSYHNIGKQWRHSRHATIRR